MVSKKRKTTKRTTTTRVVYVRERPEEDSLDRTMRTVGNVAVLGMGIGLMGAMMGGMNR